MQLEERDEEFMESLWIRTEEGKESFISSGTPEFNNELIQRLLDAGYVTSADGGVKLTETGRLIARNIIRRHRLAERLLADVLGTSELLMEEKACKFEHLLDRGLDESVCSLLGHPKICPHGKPIPAGRCCEQRRPLTQKLVSALSELNRGQRGKVAYVYAPESSQLQKLIAMGILPGAPITLEQSFPSYVFQIGQTQFAVDKDIADAIYVRLVEPEPIPESSEKSSHRRRYKFGLKRHP